MYGRLEPGGIVNILTKQPQQTYSSSVDQTLGSWGRSITNLDTTGPVDEGRILSYRLNLNYDNGTSWMQNTYSQKTFLAPTVLLQPDSQTKIKLEASYLENRAAINGYQSIPFVGTQPQWGPASSNPIPYYFNTSSEFVGLTWSHKFLDDWEIRQLIANSTSYYSTPVNISTAFSTFSQLGGIWTWQNLGLAKLSGKTQTEGTVFDLTGHLNIFGTKHTLLAGLDFYQSNTHFISAYSSVNSSGNYTSGINQSLYGPLTTSVGSITATGDLLDPNNTYSSYGTTKNFGAYLQDQFEVGKQFEFLVGLRFQNAGTYDNTGASAPHTDTAFTPRYGVVWKADEALSLYGSYSENFGATNASMLTWQGNLLKPESARQWEAGFKADFDNHRSGFTFAWFDLTKTNMAATDTTHLSLAQCQPGGPGCYINVGEIQSKGIELTFQGEIIKGWNMLLAYSHDVTDVLVGASGYTAGSPMPFVPKDMLRLFSTYKFSTPALQGWKVGGGATYQGKAPGSYTDPNTGNVSYTTFDAPSYTLFDLMTDYEFQNFKFGGNKAHFQVNVKNLFNRTNYSYAFFYSNPGCVTYGDPRAVTANLSVRF
jgi:iron complex outermembrane receptor protein